MKRLIIILSSAIIAVSVFSACGKSDENISSSSSSVSSQTSSDETEKNEAVIYIGSGTEYKESLILTDEEITPELLIEKISELTGWNLDLADDVTTGKGGMTVCFAKTSSIFTGPPEEQNEDYFVYDKEQLCQEILDSVKHTLQYNFVDPELGNPEELDVYFCTENNEPITVDDIGITIPADEPYNGLGETENNETEVQDTKTATCEFEGLGDSHSVEVILNGEVEVFQFYDETVAKKLSAMTPGDNFKCEYVIDEATSTKTLTKIID